MARGDFPDAPSSLFRVGATRHRSHILIRLLARRACSCVVEPEHWRSGASVRPGTESVGRVDPRSSAGTALSRNFACRVPCSGLANCTARARRQMPVCVGLRAKARDGRLQTEDFMS